MSCKPELHIRLKGVAELRLPGQPYETYDSYCVCSYGHARHRTRLVENSASPKWNEEFVFDPAVLAEGYEHLVKFEVFSQGLLRDELLFYGYLPLDMEAGLEDLHYQQLEQQRRQQQRCKQAVAAVAADGSTARLQQRSTRPSADTEAEDTTDPAAVAAAAAAMRRSAGQFTGKRVPGAAKAAAAADEAAVAAASAVFRATGSPGFRSEVVRHSVALLSAQGAGTSSSSSGVSSWDMGAHMANTPRPAKSLSKVRLKRSTHVRAAGELELELWWVQQPSLNNLGTPPRVVSFLHPAGMPHPLPCCAHSTLASQWEEPPLVFVRLVVGHISLGTAGAGGAGSRGSSDGGRVTTVSHAKSVLKQLRKLLRGDMAAAEGGQQQQEQQQPALPSRPTLADIHGPTSLQLLMRDGQSMSSGSTGTWDWHALGLDEDDEQSVGGSLAGSDDERTGSGSTSQRSSWRGSSGSQPGGDPERRRSSRSGCGDTAGTGAGRSEGSLTGSEGEADDVSMLDDYPGARQQQQGGRHVQFDSRQQPHKGQQRQKPSSSHSNGSARDKTNKQLHLTVKVRLGEQGPKALRPVPLGPDGSAAVCQAAVFAVVRPLEEASISYELSLGVGPRGPPVLGLVFQYSLTHLLRRSPMHPITWQEWRQVARCTVRGLQVPLPCLPGSCLDLSGFLADADCRAGMYQVPPVSTAAAQAAALDDAGAAAIAALLAQQEEEAAAAAGIPARLRDLPECETLTDSENEGGSDGDFRVAQDQQQAASSSSIVNSRAAARGSSGVFKTVLRRPVNAPQQDAAEHKQQQKGLDGLRGRGAAGVERMVDRVGEELIQAVDKLPAPMAQRVKGRFISRLFPQARRSEVFSIGQLRVMSRPRAAAPPQFNSQLQQDDLVDPAAQLLQHSSSSAFAAAVPAGVLSAGDAAALSPAAEQRGSTGSAASVTASSSLGGALLSKRNGIAQTSSRDLATAGSGEVWSVYSSNAMPLGEHPNLATAGGPGSAPLGVLQLTLQAINLRTRYGTSGLQLLMRSGPHWLQLEQPALPLTFYNSSATASAGSCSSSGSAMDVVPNSRVPPVQVLLPVYGSSCLVAILMHRRGVVVGRCVFKLYGLMPLLLRDHTKTLTLYSDKRGSGGQRIIAGSIHARLAAGPPPGYSKPGALLRLAYSYLITPYTLELHTSGVLACISRDERDDARGELVKRWLVEHGAGGQTLPEPLVGQLVSTGRGQLSTARMRAHVHRIKSVLLDWLPRRLDPLAFYHWRRPRRNLLVMWLLSHVCMYPSHWLLAVAVIFTLVLLWRIAIQIRRGVLGFELEQLPPDMAEAAGLPQQQATDDDGDEDEDMSRQLHSLRSSAGQLGGKMRRDYKEAADKLRSRLATGRQQSKSRHGDGLPRGSSPPPAATSFPKSLEELRDQLEAGTLSLDSIDIDAMAKQLLSVGGLLKLARQHSTYLLDYALMAQNMLDDAAGFAEGLYAMITAQDPLAALLFCGIFLSSAAFCYVFGVGAGVYVVICVLLRPPMLRGVPGVFGWKALLDNLPSRSVEELMA